MTYSFVPKARGNPQFHITQKGRTYWKVSFPILTTLIYLVRGQGSDLGEIGAFS